MSIEQEKVVDFVGLQTSTGRVHLSITDHLSWDEFTNEHLMMLQKKINSYLAFIESGELLKKFPKYTGKPIVIEVIGKYKPNVEAGGFYRRAIEVVANAGFELRFTTSEEFERTINDLKNENGDTYVS